MKNMSERGESIKAWETFIQSLTVEALLETYDGYSPMGTCISATAHIDGMLVGFETFLECMAILYKNRWYIFFIPLSMWDIPVNIEVEQELLHMLDFKIVRDFIRMVEL